MTDPISTGVSVDAIETRGVLRDERPPGERYFRHPGDVVRLVVWLLVAVLLLLFIELADATSGGVSEDLGEAASQIPRAVRELALAVTQVGAILVPAVVVVVLLWQRRFRRLGMLLLAAVAGAGALAAVDTLVDATGRVAGAVRDGTWIADARFPSPWYLAAAAAVAAVGKPWLGRAWRRATDVTVLALALLLAIAGTAGVPQLALAAAVGIVAGQVVLVVLGAPNRRSSPAAVAAALRGAGLDLHGLELLRADAGRSQLYVARVAGDQRLFVKVYGQDSRDADLLYRAYRTAVLRGANDDWPAASLTSDVEHEALLVLLATRAGVATPALEILRTLPDGSVALVFAYVDGVRLDELDPETMGAPLLDAVWREVAVLHAARLAHRSLRAANVLVAGGTEPELIDLGFGAESADDRLLAIDRAELLASLATRIGVEPAVAAAARGIGPEALATTLPYLQPLALSRATRAQASKGMLSALREHVSAVAAVEPVPLERLVRVRPRTLLMIAAFTAAFYVLLPQLADVGDSLDAMGDANWWWLVLCVVMSLGTYVAAAMSLAGGIPGHIPFLPTVGAQLASSFVNRVTPANVGGMALNVRFLQKTGVDPAQAVTGIGLNVAAGAIVHVVLLFAFLAWAGRSNANAFKIPSTSRILVGIAVVLAIVGLVAATRWGRRILRTHVLEFLKRGWSGLITLCRSPAKMALLLGGSTLVTLAYVSALAAAVAAFDADVSFAEVGAVYLGASIVAAAAPTPGGLGAMEAALVAGFTGVGMESGIAVAAVLSYRLLTYWLPILPGWISFQVLERKELI